MYARPVWFKSGVFVKQRRSNGHLIFLFWSFFSLQCAADGLSACRHRNFYCDPGHFELKLLNSNLTVLKTVNKIQCTKKIYIYEKKNYFLLHVELHCVHATSWWMKLQISFHSFFAPLWQLLEMKRSMSDSTWLAHFPGIDLKLNPRGLYLTFSLRAALDPAGLACVHEREPLGNVCFHVQVAAERNSSQHFLVNIIRAHTRSLPSYCRGMDGLPSNNMVS